MEIIMSTSLRHMWEDVCGTSWPVRTVLTDIEHHWPHHQTVDLSLLMSEHENKKSQALKTPWKIIQLLLMLIASMGTVFIIIFWYQESSFYISNYACYLGWTCSYFPWQRPRFLQCFCNIRILRRGPNLSSVTKGSTRDKHTHINFLGSLGSFAYCMDSILACCIRVRHSKESLKIGATYNPLSPSNL